MSFPVVGQPIYGVWTQSSEAAADLESRLAGIPSYPVLAGELGVTNATYPYNDARRFGVLHDGKSLLDVTVTLGSATLTSPSAPFKVTDVGKLITIWGAGAAGVPLATTIQAFVNTATVTLGATASATVTGVPARCIYGSDDSTSMLAAMATGRSMNFPNGIYCHSQTITYSRVHQRMIGEACGGYYTDSNPTQGVSFCYMGAIGGTQVRVPTGMHRAQISQIDFNANDLANTCVHFDVSTGESLQFPSLHDYSLRGYRGAAVIFGKSDSTVLGAGQLQMVPLRDGVWWGGGPSATPANVWGILLNAQNCEIVAGAALYMDPFTALGGGPYLNHWHHVAVKAGSFHCDALVTTRASDYALKSLTAGDGAFVVNHHRSEDIFLMQTAAVEPSNPLSYTNVEGRSGLATGNETAIDINNAGGALVSLTNIRSPGNVRVSGNNDIQARVRNLYFKKKAAKTVTAVDTVNDVITIVAHGFSSGQRVFYNPNGGGIGGLTDSASLTVPFYYVLTPAADTFKLSTSPGGAQTDLTSFAGAPTFAAWPDLRNTGVTTGALDFEPKPGEKQVWNTNSVVEWTSNAAARLWKNTGGRLRIKSIQTTTASNESQGFIPGSLTITDAATSGVFNFPIAEPDASYTPEFVLLSSTGTPAAGAYTQMAPTRATGTVTLNLLAAPGVGNSVTYRVKLSRS